MATSKINNLNSSSNEENSEEDRLPKLKREETNDCAVCLQPCLQPVKLPCSHIFCFLCAKGIAFQNRVCALCRAPIPQSFLENPDQFKHTSSSSKLNEDAQKYEYVWFYQGYRGWWQYDERSNKEIEEAYQQQKQSIQILIAGNLYEINLVDMQQYQCNRSSRKRKIKRDKLAIQKKGVAGMSTNSNTASTSSSDNQAGNLNPNIDNITAPVSGNMNAVNNANQPVVVIDRQMPLGAATVDVLPSLGLTQDIEMSSDSDSNDEDIADPPMQRSVTTNVQNSYDTQNYTPPITRSNTLS